MTAYAVPGAGGIIRTASPQPFRSPAMPTTMMAPAVVASSLAANAPQSILAPLMMASTMATAPATVMQMAAPSSVHASVMTMAPPSTVPAPVLAAATVSSVQMASPASPTVGSRLCAAAAAAAAAQVPGQIVPLGEWKPPVAPPVSITQGMPDPITVQRQKEGYVRTLDDQLRQGAVTLDNQHKQQRDTMHQAAEQQKQQFGQQVDQQVKMQEMDLDHQFLQVLQYVKQQATRQRAQLEQQAMQLSFEYQEKKVEEDMLAHQFELSKNQQVLKTQMLQQGPLSPLPSYLPVSSSMQSATLQVPSNPFAANQLGAMARDAVAPQLSYSPCTVAPYEEHLWRHSSSYVPPQAIPTTTIMAPATVTLPTTTAAYVGRTPSYQPAPMAPATVTMAPGTMTYARTPSYQPNAYAQPTYATVLSPQPSAATLPVVMATVM